MLTNSFNSLIDKKPHALLSKITYYFLKIIIIPLFIQIAYTRLLIDSVKKPSFSNILLNLGTAFMFNLTAQIVFRLVENYNNQFYNISIHHNSGGNHNYSDWKIYEYFKEFTPYSKLKVFGYYKEFKPKQEYPILNDFHFSTLHIVIINIILMIFGGNNLFKSYLQLNQTSHSFKNFTNLSQIFAPAKFLKVLDENNIYSKITDFFLKIAPAPVTPITLAVSLFIKFDPFKTLNTIIIDQILPEKFSNLSFKCISQTPPVIEEAIEEDDIEILDEIKEYIRENYNWVEKNLENNTNSSVKYKSSVTEFKQSFSRF